MKPLLLWFAWKIVLLQYRKQPTVYLVLAANSCDLLEKSYFCSIANNFFIHYLRPFVVVICLKNRTFAVSQTTRLAAVHHELMLWFAWKIVLLQYRKQLRNVHTMYIHVVICLKNRTFAVSQTTAANDNARQIELWFAWKIVLLQYRKQPSS